MPADDILASLGLADLMGDRALSRDSTTGSLINLAGLRTACLPREFLSSFRLVLDRESAGAWRTVHQSAGRTAGRNVAAQLDTHLARLAKPALSALPFEACLALVERYLGLHGWGRLQLDLADAAEHGLVVARLEHSPFADALADTEDFVDPLLAGLLQGFFEYISGQPLGCAEIACVRRGAPCCTFVITAQERLDAVAPFAGTEPAAAILARMKS